MNRTGSKILHGLLLATSGLVGSTVIASTAAMAGGPTGGKVAVGSATIVNASPTQTVINQSSNKALINWNSFSIPGGSSVQFNQPGKKSLTVNRVTGPNASVIDGALQANGNIWLLNANGVLFGKGSQINVGALLATTSDISDNDFKSGNYTFNPSANPDASVVNKGTIVVNSGGSVVLSAPHVSNEGLIQANLGTVVLGGAKAFTVDMTGDNLLRYQVTAPVDSAPKNANGSVAEALVSNSGTIMAAGGHVVMTARAARNVEDNVINNTGMVEATTVSSHNGVIDLDAGPDGTVNDSGTLNASGTAAGQTGGAVNVTGGTVNVADGAKIDVSGNAGGGTAQIGGGLHGQGTLAHAQNTNIGNATIVADATGKGDGGTVAIWSDGSTSFAGTISARGGAQGGNGGQVETSGHTLSVASTAKVNTAAPIGLTGDWLLDPDDIIISDGGSATLPGNGTLSGGSGTETIDPDTITNQLDSTNVTLEATNSIEVCATLAYSSSNTLSLLSEGDIYINAGIQNASDGAINVIAGWDGTTFSFSTGMSSTIYGFNGGNISIGTGNGDVSVGSHGGLTILAGYDVTMLSDGGNAQIGYHGAGGGDITVLSNDALSLDTGATGHTAQIGNGGTDVSGDVGGNISILAPNVTVLAGSGIAAIGNIAQGPTASQSGNITINTDADLTLEVSGNAGNAVAQIGNWAASGTTGGATGDINLSIGGELDVLALGDASRVTIGDGSKSFANNGASGGNITVHAGSININAQDSGHGAQARIGNRGGTTVSGDIDVETDPGGDFYITAADGLDLAGIGNGSSGTGATDTTSGNITIVSGSLLDIAATGSGNARISNGNAPDSDITVTADAAITMRVLAGTGTGGKSLIGNFGNDYTAAGGNISVTSTNNDISLTANVNDSFAVIGNGLGTSTSGNVEINALDATNGAVNLHASAQNSLVQIGNLAEVGDISGDVTVNTAKLLISAEASNAIATLGHLGMNADGSQSGGITVNSGGDVTLDASDAFAIAQIGNWSNTDTSGTATGTINIFADGNLAMLSSGSRSRTIIGNGGGAFTGNVEDFTSSNAGGDITVQAANVSVSASGQSSSFAQARIGQRAADFASGNIDVEATDANATFAITADGTDLASIGNGIGLTTSSSTGNITVSSCGTLAIEATDSGQARIAGSYTADSNIFVDANGTISLTVSGTPGNYPTGGPAPGQALIGNFGNGFASTVGGNISVTSAKGSVTLQAQEDGAFVGIGNTSGAATTTGNILVSALNGTVSLTSSGNVASAYDSDLDDTVSYSAISEIGNNTSSGNITGNITVNADQLSIDAQGASSIAVLGHLGDGADSSQSGDITANVTANMSVTASGSNHSIAQVGHWSDVQTSGGATGTIEITVGTDFDLAATGDGSQATIGNGGRNFTSGGQTGGDITLIAATIGITASDDTSFAQASIGNRGAGSVVGNLDIETTAGDFMITADNSDLASVGNRGGSQTASSSGNITVASAGALNITGNDTGQARIAGGLASNTNIDVTAAGNILLSVSGNQDDLGQGMQSGMAQIGNFGNGITNAGGDVAVTSTGGNISLDAEEYGSQVTIGNSSGLNSTSGNVTVTTSDVAIGDINLNAIGDSTLVQIGNSSPASTIGGNVTVNAGHDIGIDASGNTAIAQIGNGSLYDSGYTGGDISGTINVTSGSNIEIDAEQQDAIAQIGNGDPRMGRAGNVNGDILVKAGSIDFNDEDTDPGTAWIGNTADAGEGYSYTGNLTMIFQDGVVGGDIIGADLAGGDVFIGYTGQGGSWGGLTYDSAHTLSIATVGGITIDGTTQNTGSGTINIVAGWDGHTTALSSLMDDGVYGNGGATVTIGGASSVGGTSIIGSKNGTTNVLTDSLLVSANSYGGVAQLGYYGAGTGAIYVHALSDVTVQTEADATVAQIGNGGYGKTGAIEGDVSILAGGNITVQTDSSAAIAAIGNIGGESSSQSGNITIDADGAVGLIAQNVSANAQIGNQQVGSAPSQRGDVSGDISITSDSVLISATGENTAAVIGTGNDLLNNQNSSGHITVDTGDLTLSSSSSTSNGTLALLGSRGLASAASVIDVDATGVISLTTGSYGNVFIGQGSYGTASGNITVSGGDAIDLHAAGVTSLVRIGNAGHDAGGDVMVTASDSDLGDIDLHAGSDNSLVQIGNSSPSGTIGGSITVDAGHDLSLSSSANGTVVQIGNGSLYDSGFTGGDIGGNIDVTAGGHLDMEADQPTSFAQIGNGDPKSERAGNVSGDIFISVGGDIDAGDASGLAWIGNTVNAGEGGGFAASGNLTLIAHDAELDGDILDAALANGNVFLGTTDDTELDDFTYNSAHTLSIAATGNIDIYGMTRNDGFGAINIVAGWDGQTTDLSSLTAAGVYGNGGDIFISAIGERAGVGSKSGATTLAANDISIESGFGDDGDFSVAQVGYDGVGATGDIKIVAAGDVMLTGGEGAYNIAQIGNGGIDVSGAVGGNISITTESGNVIFESAADNTLTMIGNLGGSGASESGNIAINTNGGALTLTADNDGEYGIGLAHIGNMAFDFAQGSTTGTASGNITINAGAIAVAATGGYSYAEIGNGIYHDFADTGALSGNINIQATTLSLVSDAGEGSAQARIGHLGVGAVSGDINISTTGLLSITGNDYGLSSIGSVSAPIDSGENPLQGQGSGNITIQSGGNIVLASQEGGYARIESGGFTSGSINVGATGDISLTANGSWTNIGAFQSGNGTVNITVASSAGDIGLTATGTHGVVQIGNLANGAPGSIGGAINVTAANATHGNITISASGNGTAAVIGTIGYGDSVTGNINVLAGNMLQITGNAALTQVPGGADGTLAQIGNTNVSLYDATISGTRSGNVIVTANSVDGIGGSVFNDLPGGDFTLNSLGTGTVEIDDGGAYSSSHNFVLNSGGNVVIESSIQNSGTGSITFVSAGNVTVGGSGATGSVAFGSKGGVTAVSAKNLLVSAVNGNAQLGYSGAGTGAINVNTTGNVTVQTAGNGTVALIGNGGYGLTGAIQGDISIIAGGDVAVLTNSSLAMAAIGDIGGEGSSQSGNITISSGGQVSVVAQNSTSNAQIGNQQTGSATPSQRGDASGNIAITSKSVLISATGTNTAAAIGNGNSLLRNQNASGAITVNTGDLAIASSATTSNGTVALLGSRGYNSANSAIKVNASGNISLVAGNYGNALIGQGSYGTASGDISINSDNNWITIPAANGTVALVANGTASQARIGNSGVTASGNIAVETGGALSIAKSAGATSLIGNSASGGALAGSTLIVAKSVVGIGDSIVNDFPGGDFSLNSFGSGPLEIKSGGSFSSTHNLIVQSGGDLLLEGSLQNDSSANSGEMAFVASGNITIGGAGASGNVAIGSKTASVRLVTLGGGDVLLSAVNGYAQLGYHGGDSANLITVSSSGDVVLSGGGGTAYYAQIGNGGYKTAGSSNWHSGSEAYDILISGQNIELDGGSGQEAYAQIGNGGAESNSNSSGYSQHGVIDVIGTTVVLDAGSGTGSYSQIGHGGYKSGQSLHGIATLGVSTDYVEIAAQKSVQLIGGGDDAYAQIGHGGDLVNSNAANGSSGTIAGNIVVGVSAPKVSGQDQITLMAGTGANSYVQIGNGGQGENTPVAGAKVNFAISGNVAIADLLLSGSDTGANGYAQIGNGDASKTGTGNVSGSVTLTQGTKITYDPGKAPGASTGFGNATGTGTVTGTAASSGVNAGTQGSVASISQTTTNPTSFTFSTFTTTPGYVQQLASIDTLSGKQGPTPLEMLSDNSEQGIASDGVAESVGQSLGEGKTIYVSSKTIIPGLLKQFVTLTPNNPHGVPPADVDYSSWGNEALWRW